MKRALCLILLLSVLSTKYVLCQVKCKSSIVYLQHVVKSLDSSLDDSVVSQKIYLEFRNRIDPIINHINSQCPNRDLLKNWVFVTARWKKLRGDLTRPYKHALALKRLSNNYQDFFTAVDALVLADPIIPVDLIKPIDSLVKKNLKDSLHPVSDTLLSIDSAIQKVDSAVQRVDLISRKIDTITTAVSLKTDTVLRSSRFIQGKVIEIDSMLRSNVTGKRNLVSAGAYSDGLYSLGYAHIFRNKKDTLFPVVAGMEVFFPLNSAKVHHLGIFGTGGFYYKHFILQVGAGYLDRAQYYNISWKGSVDFVSSYYGMGISYSPLTGTGIRIYFRLGK